MEDFRISFPLVISMYLYPTDSKVLFNLFLPRYIYMYKQKIPLQLKKIYCMVNGVRVRYIQVQVTGYKANDKGCESRKFITIQVLWYLLINKYERIYVSVSVLISRPMWSIDILSTYLILSSFMFLVINIIWDGYWAHYTIDKNIWMVLVII